MPSKPSATPSKKLPFKLRRKPKDEVYDTDFCCASKCNANASIVEATHNYSKDDMPLCDAHWEKIAEEK